MVGLPSSHQGGRKPCRGSRNPSSGKGAELAVTVSIVTSGALRCLAKLEGEGGNHSWAQGRSCWGRGLLGTTVLTLDCGSGICPSYVKHREPGPAPWRWWSGTSRARIAQWMVLMHTWGLGREWTSGEQAGAGTAGDSGTGARWVRGCEHVEQEGGEGSPSEPEVASSSKLGVPWTSRGSRVGCKSRDCWHACCLS